MKRHFPLSVKLTGQNGINRGLDEVTFAGNTIGTTTVSVKSTDSLGGANESPEDSAILAGLTAGTVSTTTFPVSLDLGTSGDDPSDIVGRIL